MSPRGEQRKLPDFPWDRLIPIRERAAAHPDGLVDLSVGTPVDPVPEVIQLALAQNTDKPGYPTTHGTPELRSAIQGWLQRRLFVDVPESDILPVIGTKEFIAGLPSLLGLGSQDIVVIPEVAYPTYEVGALMARAQPLRADSLTAIGPARPSLLWLNSPSNPTGRVLGVPHLRKVVQWARERGVIVASDECYIELGWEGDEPVSILNPAVCDGDTSGLLAVQSLSKRSNLAGYRFGLCAGDPKLVARLLEIRKHCGFLVPAPIQAAATVAFSDDNHVVEQRRRYRRRRDQLFPAISAAGFRIDSSQAGLYLWATRDEPAMQSVEWFAGRGIMVTPGDFYGEAGNSHVRIGLTATDERIASAVSRLLAPS